MTHTTLRAKAGPTSRAHCGTVGRHSRARRRGRYFIVSILCAACIVQFASHAARAQCTARDVLQNQLKLKMLPAEAPQQLIKSDRDVATWKTITIGTFADPLGLRNKMHGMGCSIGGQAAEILARPTFVLGSGKTELELVLVSPVQLGFTSDMVTLADVYARARQLGFELAAAEVGPQLRIQYLDQPIGEFLIIGMEPIKTWSGEPIILNVANGGAGLILIGQDGRAEAEIHVTSRLVFARAHQSASGTDLIDRVAAFQPP
ncbi:hypothetical protein [Bradyrhizobium cajani]|uniref:hypothetical protein n=1 Tax=Bradyrhizobium cajani TaxID=1928661 RepID=UPI00359C81A4